MCGLGATSHSLCTAFVLRFGPNRLAQQSPLTPPTAVVVPSVILVDVAGSRRPTVQRPLSLIAQKHRTSSNLTDNSPSLLAFPSYGCTAVRLASLPRVIQILGVVHKGVGSDLLLVSHALRSDESN